MIVLDAPAAPEGPLEMSDVRADQATLSWKPPADDFGAPVSDYVVEMLDPDTGIPCYADLDCHAVHSVWTAEQSNAILS